MEERIIPFGKHKGKPIEFLATDKQYLDWLLAQSWFREKYLNIYNIVINNFREPVDTPEHNKIQIKFLKLEYRLKLAFLVNPKLFENNSIKLNQEIYKVLQIKENKECEYFIDSLKNPNENIEFGLYTTQLLKYSNPVFEKVDVYYNLWYGLEFYYNTRTDNYQRFDHQKLSSYWLEIKPTISDDFPSVLRQMKASMPYQQNVYNRDKFFILLVGEYIGTSVTKLEFIEYFRTQGYIVIFEKQINVVELPEFDKELILDEKIKEQIKHIS